MVVGVGVVIVGGCGEGEICKTDRWELRDLTGI